MDIERKSIGKPTGGTLRWTAPEILSGHRLSFGSDGQSCVCAVVACASKLIQETVYAFAITICEMLAPDDLPYGYIDSQTVRAMVLLGERCIIPPTAPEVRALVGRYWEHSERTILILGTSGHLTRVASQSPPKGLHSRLSFLFSRNYFLVPTVERPPPPSNLSVCDL
jgi:hypothetical protein